MSPTRAQRVRDRAHGRCEYCQMRQELDVQPFQIDRIRAKKHGGMTTDSNLCLCCLPCNTYKSSNIAGIDPVTGQLQPLYDPRQSVWNEHFEWHGPELIGITPMGRATIDVLRINRSDRVEHRRVLRALGLSPG